MVERRYKDAAAFRRALDGRLKAGAREQDVPLQRLRRQFVLECFLARVFSLPHQRWSLKGGTGLAVRLPAARYSRDLDLCNTSTDPDLAVCVDELIAVGRATDRDPFIFEIARRTELTGNAQGLQLTVTARLGARQFEAFPIDLTVRLHFVGQVEIVHKQLPVQIDDVQDPPPMRLYPLADQVADKVAAMYETHNGRPSGRFRDLVDLVLISTATELDQQLVEAALRIQETTRRMTLPVRMTPPGPAWYNGYAAEAQRTPLDQTLRSLDGALRRVGEILDPILSRLTAT